MNSKGYLFSAIVILLLGSLVFISASYLDKSDKFDNLVQQSFIYNKFRYVENDIATDYLSIMNVTLMNITRDEANNEIILRFSNFGVLPRRSLEDNLSEYEKFIQQNYSKLIGMDVKLTHITPNMTFTGYNTTFVIHDDSQEGLDIFTDDYLSIKSVNVTVEINQNISNDQCPSNDAQGDAKVHLNVCYNGEMKLNCIRQLKAIGTCASQVFLVKHEGNEVQEEVQIMYCNYLGNEGTVKVNASSGLRAEITNLRYTYDLIDAQTWLESSDTNLYINPKEGNIVKNTSLILGEESYYRFAPSQQGCRGSGLTCAGYCHSLGYTNGACRANAQQCTNNGEVNEVGGNQYCNGGPSADTCCCG